MPFRQLTVSGFPALALSNDEIEVVCVPSLGGKLTNLRRHRGREWLWRNPAIPLRESEWGASYVETADSGGWDECFPTVGPSPMPGAAPGEPLLLDHGELWALPWQHTVSDGPDGVTLTGRVEGRLLPYDFQREITLPERGAEIGISYLLRHRGEVPFPFIWAAHPLLNVQRGTRLVLPAAGRTRVISAVGRADLSEGEELPYPFEHEGGGWEFPGDAGWALMLGVDLGPSRRIEVTDPVRGERMMIETSAGVDQVGLWINAGGWVPSQLNGRPGPAPYVNLGIEPCIGVPDRLDRAAGRWNGAATLHVGEELRWSVRVSLPDPAAE